MTELVGSDRVLLKARYELLETLGAGGEARVVKALDHQHQRLVVLKLRAVRSALARDELLREARVLLGLPPNPALPLVREDFFDGDQYAVVMDWVEGIDLATLLRDRGSPGLAPSNVLAYLAEVAEALTFLHTQDPPVVHGDVKPANLILTRGGHVKLVDFGLSSALGVGGQRAGTVGFRAPELSAGGPPSRATDIYALAATAFALLSGSPPAGVLPTWDGLDPAQAAQLERGIREGLATDPAHRPATAGEFVERMRAGWGSTLPTGVVTFCLSDIVGSTALWESHPELMASSLVRHDELIAHAVEARRGRFLKSMGEGDSTFSVFASATDAVVAAIAAASALRAEPWSPGCVITARFGLHTGEAEQRGADYFGTTVNLAARVRAEAHGAEIVLSEATVAVARAHLPSGYSLVDLGPHPLKGVRAPERLHAVTGGELVTAARMECPYRGLRAFEPDNREFFFGREEVLGELLAAVGPQRLLALVGASGSGKSSVLRAGVVAAVEAREVPGVDSARLITPGSRPQPELDDDPRMLLVVDQFEELFTQCRDDELRDAFIAALLSRRGPVVIGVRADFYGELGGDARLARAVSSNQILLGPMRDEDLRRAVEEPARLVGLRLGAGLVDLVLRDVAGEPGALPLMSHALRASWERREGRTLTVDAYRASGGVSSALARTADAVVDRVPESSRALLRNMFLRLTDLGDGVEDTRRRVRVDELVPAGSSDVTVRSLIETLTDARLLTVDAGTVEVAHEVLIRRWPRLRTWLEEDRDGIRLHRRLGDAARLWVSSGRETADLYRGARLEAASEWASANQALLNAAERDFLDASVSESTRARRAQLRINRRLRRSLLGIGVLLIAALALALIALASRHDAVRAEASVQSRALAASSESQLGRDPQVALLLARAALRSAPTPDAELAATEALDSNTIRSQLPSIGQQTCLPASRMTLLDGGREAAVTTCNGDVALEDLVNRRIVRRIRVGATAGSVDLSPSGRTIAVGADDGVVLLNARTGAIQTRVNAGFPIRFVAYSPSGARLAVAGDGPVAVVDLGTRRVRTVAMGDPTYDVVYGVSWLSAQRLFVGTSGGPGGRGDLGYGLNVVDLRSGRRTQVDLAGRGAAAAVERVVFARPQGIWYVTGQQQYANTTYGAKVWAYDPHENRVLWSAAGPEGHFGTALALSPDRRLLAVGFGQGTSEVLDARTGRLVVSLPGSSAAVRGIAFRSGPSPIVTSSQDGVVRTWAESGSEADRLQLPPGPVFDYTTDGRHIIAVGAHGMISALPSGRVVRSLPGFPYNASNSNCTASCVAYAPGVSWLSYIDPTARQPTVRVINESTGHRTGSIRAGQIDTDSIAPDGRVAIVAIAGQRVSVALYSPYGRLVRRFAPVASGDGCTPTGAFSPDGSRFAVADGCNYVIVWDVSTGRALRKTEITGRLGGGFAITPNDRFVLTGLAGGALARIDLTTGSLQERPGSKTEANAVAISPDGRFYAISRNDGSVDLYDARTFRLVRHHVLNNATVLNLAFSPDGRQLAALDGAFVLHIWDTCDICENAGALARTAARESARQLTTDERATFGVSN